MSADTVSRWLEEGRRPRDHSFTLFLDYLRAQHPDISTEELQAAYADFWTSLTRPAAPSVRLARTDDRMVLRGEVDLVVSALLASADVGITGPGGTGKTVLAEQVANDPRVVHHFAAGRWRVVVGEAAQPEVLAGGLVHAITGREPSSHSSALVQLAACPVASPGLVILDDVWAPDDAVREVVASLPRSVVVLATSRGIVIDGAATVPLMGMRDEEARTLLLCHCSDRSSEVLEAASDLLDAVARWPMLVSMAARLIDSDLRSTSSVAAAALRQLSSAFADDPTRLDDDRSRSRSFDRMIGRSLDALAAVDRERFESLSLFPSHVSIDAQHLAVVWGCDEVDARRTQVRLQEVGLVTRFGAPPRLALHDLIASWLHVRHGHPGDHPARHLEVLERAFAPEFDLDRVDSSNVHWLAHHVVGAGRWDIAELIRTRAAQVAFRQATGTDRAYQATLSDLARASLGLPDEADRIRHALGSYLMIVLAREYESAIPIGVRVVQAVVEGVPTAAAQTLDCGIDAPKRAQELMVALAKQSLIEDHVPALLEMFSRVPDSTVRNETLSLLAQAHMGHGDERHFDRAAVEAIIDLMDPGYAADETRLLLAHRLTVDSTPTSLAQAIAIANSLPDWRGAIACASVGASAWATMPAEARTLLERAERIARSQADPSIRADLLGRIAEQIGGLDLAWAVALFSEACECLDEIRVYQTSFKLEESLARRQRALRPLESVGDVALAFEAADLLRPAVRAHVLGEVVVNVIAPHWREPAWVRWGLAIADEIPSRQERDDAIARAALAIVNAEQMCPEVSTAVWELIDQTSSVVAQSWAMAGIGWRLTSAGELQASYFRREATNVARASWGLERCRALGEVAKEAAESGPTQRRLLLREALHALAAPAGHEPDTTASAARAATTEFWYRVAVDDPFEVLTDIARAVPEAVIDLLRYARWQQTPEMVDHYTGWALRAVVEGEPKTVVGLEVLVDAARGINDVKHRVRSIAGIAAWISAIDPQRAQELADEAVSYNVPLWYRADLLAEVAGRVLDHDRGHAEQLIDVAAESLVVRKDREEMLSEIALRMVEVAPGDLAWGDKALEVVARMGEGEEKDETAHAVRTIVDRPEFADMLSISVDDHFDYMSESVETDSAAIVNRAHSKAVRAALDQQGPNWLNDASISASRITTKVRRDSAWAAIGGRSASIATWLGESGGLHGTVDHALDGLLTFLEEIPPPELPAMAAAIAGTVSAAFVEYLPPSGSSRPPAE